MRRLRPLRPAWMLDVSGAARAAAPPVRGRILVARGAEARIDAAASDEAALRSWMGFLALPAHVPLASRLAWESADLIWRWAGDEATERRATLRPLRGEVERRRPVARPRQGERFLVGDHGTSRL